MSVSTTRMCLIILACLCCAMKMQALSNADVIAVFAGHKEYKTLRPEAVKRLTGRDHPVIVDGRNIIDPDRFIAEGFVYKGIGRGDKNDHPIV